MSVSSSSPTLAVLQGKLSPLWLALGAAAWGKRQAHELPSDVLKRYWAVVAASWNGVGDSQGPRFDIDPRGWHTRKTVVTTEHYSILDDHPLLQFWYSLLPVNVFS